MSIFTNLFLWISFSLRGIFHTLFFKIFLVLFIFGTLHISPTGAKAASSNIKTRTSEMPPPATQARWRRILSTLNQNSEPTRSHFLPSNQSIFSHTLEDELLVLNQREMSAIKASWQALVGNRTTTDKRAAREQENAYFRKKIEVLNAPLFLSLKKTSLNIRSENISYVKIAETVLAKVQANSIAKLENAARYDSNGQIGHCFGRALLVHLSLLQAGVRQEHLAKIFNVGQLMVGQHLWRFHVAVMVSDSKFGYLVVDPLQKKPLPYEEWIEVNANYDIKGHYSRARFYVTDPRKFLPGFHMYSMAQLENPVLKPYFDDLVKSIED